MKTARLWIGCLLTTIFVSKVVAAAASIEAPLTVLIYDRAHVGSKTLTQAERLASEIFARAGVVAQWTTRSVSDGGALLNDFSAPAGEACAQPLDSATVRVEILPHAPSGFSRQALGYALPCAKRGMQVTIYADRVEIVSRASLAGFYRVLGYTIAHELGHVVLRSCAHDSSGLMKGVWAKSDWQRAAVTIIPFTASQARWVLQELLLIEAHETATLQTSARLRQ
jgi:hypothetical protein